MGRDNKRSPATSTSKRAPQAAARPGPTPGAGEIIYVAGGVYFTSLTLKSEIQLFGGYEGVSGAPGARDLVAYPTTIDASTIDAGAPARHAVYLSGVTNTRLDGFIITGATPQTVDHGSNGSAVTAVPNTGYHFVQWSDASTAKPCGIAGKGPDFGLKTKEHLYLFVHNLYAPRGGNVTYEVRGTGPRAFTGVQGKVAKAEWLDSGEQLKFEQNAERGEFTLNATRFPYGTNTVVRIAKLSV